MRFFGQLAGIPFLSMTEAQINLLYYPAGENMGREQLQ